MRAIEDKAGIGADASESGQPGGAIVDEEIWLLGQPPVRDYLDFVRRAVVGGADLAPSALVDEWRKANDWYAELEDREAGIADRAECRDLDAGLAPLVEEVTADAGFRNAFDTLPTRFGMVELDKLVVHQTSVTGNFVESIRAKLGPSPDPEALFRFCMPLGKPQARVSVQQVGSRRFLFRSESTDFRPHDPVLLSADDVPGHRSFGPIANIVGLVVGFGANFLSVVRVDNRLLLHNGYHRACALRSLGITHAPAVIQTVTRGEELPLGAKDTVCSDPDFYFRSARPPLLKDFFDPRIRKELKVRRHVRLIEVSFDVRDYLVPE